MALIVALLLLVVITLLGFVAVRSTILQQKMASNQYDRQIAFQNAEAALRVAASQIPSKSSIVWHNCQSGGAVCYANPFDDPNLTSGDVHTVATSNYTVNGAADGQPQYVVENMGNWVDFSTSTGFDQSANGHQYNAQGKSITAVYYRITARSGDPSKVDGRAVVTLQAYVKRI